MRYAALDEPEPLLTPPGSPCGAGSRRGGGMDCSDSRPRLWSPRCRFRHVATPSNRPSIMCGGPAPCSASNHEDSHGTEQPDAWTNGAARSAHGRLRSSSRSGTNRPATAGSLAPDRPL